MDSTSRPLSKCMHEVVANKPFKSLLTSISIFEKNLPKEMVNGTFTSTPVNHLAVTGSMCTGICWYPQLMSGQATASSLRCRKLRILFSEF